MRIVRHLQLIAILFLALTFCYCSKKSDVTAPTSSGSAAPAAANAKTATASAASEPSGDASFSAVIDGKAVSGKGADPNRVYNVALKSSSDIGPLITSELWDSTKNSRNEYNYALRLSFLQKEGNWSITPDSPDEAPASVTVYINTDPAHMMTYFPDFMKFEVSELTATRVSGTFSGKFKLDNAGRVPGGDYSVSSDGKVKEKKEITVTAGKFDLPIIPPVSP